MSQTPRLCYTHAMLQTEARIAVTQQVIQVVNTVPLPPLYVPEFLWRRSLYCTKYLSHLLCKCTTSNKLRALLSGHCVVRRYLWYFVPCLFTTIEDKSRYLFSKHSKKIFKKINVICQGNNTIDWNCWIWGEWTVIVDN